jgi:hypothetical protein
MGAGPDGSLFVSIPMESGAVLAILDRNGKPRPGWPIALARGTTCRELQVSQDGSVRALCTLQDPDGSPSSDGAVAFDSSGRMLTGWPVSLGADLLSARLSGGDLTILASWPLVDLEDGRPNEALGVVTVAADGSVHSGVQVPMYCCEASPSIGADGIAAAVIDISGDESKITSKVVTLDTSGVPSAWPVAIDGIAATPAFGSDGRILVAAGSLNKTTSDIVALDRDGQVGDESTIPIIMADSWGDTGGCSSSPRQPLVADDGTVVVFSEADPTVFALNPSLMPKPGWPYAPPQPLVLRDERYVKEDAYCPSLAIPAVGRDGSVYLPLQARTSSVGGNLAAVGPNGGMRAGWPVELKRAGSEFWSVVVGPDGTTFALAIEPESSTTSSASILAIEPDSTVRYATTIINP